MKTEDLIKILTPIADICVKKKIKYSCIAQDIVYIDTFKNLIKRAFTIIPYRYIPDIYINKIFETRINGFVEDEFRIREQDVLVVGCINELYKMNLNQDFDICGSRRIYTPKQILYFCVKVTKEIYKWYIDNDNSTTTNWDIIFCNIGDYIIFHDNYLKKINKDIFETTYIVLTI